MYNNDIKKSVNKQIRAAGQPMREEATNLDDCADTRHNVTTKWGAETGKLCQANKKKLSQICPPCLWWTQAFKLHIY